MKTNLILILLALSLLLVSCGKKEEDKEHPAPRTGEAVVTLVLGVENRQKLARGWNDITMLIYDYPEEICVGMIPRDTLVDIPTKGKWTLNSLYLVYGIHNMMKWFKDTYNVKIDHYVVINMNKEKLRPIHTLLGLDTKFEYDQAWLRHRHKLKYGDYDRILRIQTFAERLIKRAKNIPNIGTKLAATTVIKFAEKTDIDNVNDYYHLELAESFKTKKVKFFVPSGYYHKTYFNLVKKYNNYTFQEGWKQTYHIIGTNMHFEKIRSRFKYMTNDMFAVNGSTTTTPKYNVNYIEYATNWEGGLLYKQPGK